MEKGRLFFQHYRLRRLVLSRFDDTSRGIFTDQSIAGRNEDEEHSAADLDESPLVQLQQPHRSPRELGQSSASFNYPPYLLNRRGTRNF